MQDRKFEDDNFSLNSKGYIEFNKNLIIDSRYKLTQEIILDEELGTTAKGRYGSVFRVKDLKDGQIKALKINRIPPEEEDAKRQAAKEQLKNQQQNKNNNNNNNNKHEQNNGHNNNNNNNNNNTNNGHHYKSRIKTVTERYKSSCKREIGVLKRITRKNQNEQIPCLVLYDYGEYLGHTYMIFPVYDLPLQQHLTNVQKYQDIIHKTNKNGNNPPNTAPNNALIHPDDLWAFEEQLISALSYIHNVCNVMHLDFKPKNIMINKYGYDIIKYAKNLHLIKLKQNAITLIDFSVSAKAPKKANLDDVRYSGNFGTRRYRPPEMIYGGKWNRSVDTYGTALIILESIKLYPIIDTTYYKKKKILKYKKKLKKQQQQQQQQQPAQSNGNHRKLTSNYKQLDISEVLYLIIQQIGFPDKDYWDNLTLNEKNLFPQLPLIENIGKKGKKSKLFEQDISDLKKQMKQQQNEHELKSNGHDNNHQNGNNDKGDSDDDDDDEEEDDDEEDIEDILAWNLLSDRLKSHRGTSWNLFKHYGSNLIKTSSLDKMEESLKKMVVWDPRSRITPEQVLKEYFPKTKTYNHSNFDFHENDDDD